LAKKRIAVQNAGQLGQERHFARYKAVGIKLPSKKFKLRHYRNNLAKNNPKKFLHFFILLLL
jgi:hypothetical protein